MNGHWVRLRALPASMSGVIICAGHSSCRIDDITIRWVGPAFPKENEACELSAGVQSWLRTPLFAPLSTGTPMKIGIGESSFRLLPRKFANFNVFGLNAIVELKSLWMFQFHLTVPQQAQGHYLRKVPWTPQQSVKLYICPLMFVP